MYQLASVFTLSRGLHVEPRSGKGGFHEIQAPVGLGTYKSGSTATDRYRKVQVPPGGTLDIEREHLSFALPSALQAPNDLKNFNKWPPLWTGSLLSTSGTQGPMPDPQMPLMCQNIQFLNDSGGIAPKCN